VATTGRTARSRARRRVRERQRFRFMAVLHGGSLRRRLVAPGVHLH
jgi:hypothetical protein